jgi:hypothetical protein
MRDPCRHGHTDGALHKPCWQCKYEAAQRKIEKLKLESEPMCNVCVGTGDPGTGKPCICGGRGTQAAELQGFIERVYELEADAERYRYMRLNAVYQFRNGPGIYWYLPMWDRNLPIDERLDKAIDAQLER